MLNMMSVTVAWVGVPQRVEEVFSVNFTASGEWSPVTCYYFSLLLCYHDADCATLNSVIIPKYIIIVQAYWLPATH